MSEDSNQQSEPYVFYGTVLPQRAQLTFQFNLGFAHVSSGVQGEARISIILNELVGWVFSEHEWDIFDLRNVVKTMVQNRLAIVGYLRGFAYDLEISRIVNLQRNIDYVFGIEVPCIAEARASVDLHASLLAMHALTIGAEGILLHRCFTDLVSAMKHADDTGFYCYRAIESLRHHCSAQNRLTQASNAEQWRRFREIAGCSEEALRSIKVSADPLRHGEASSGGGDERAILFKTTWAVVDGYIDAIKARTD